MMSAMENEVKGQTQRKCHVSELKEPYHTVIFNIHFSPGPVEAVNKELDSLKYCGCFHLLKGC